MTKCVTIGAMTGLQSGTPAGALAPQNYSNSTQDTVFQDATGRATFQNTPTTGQTLNSPVQGTSLQVSGNPPTSAVLGIDTVALNREATKTNDQSVVLPMLAIAIISFALFVYFWKQTRTLIADAIENHDEESKD